jgi:dolichol kinase
MSPGVLPFVMLGIPHPDPLPWYAQAVILSVSTALAIFAIKRAELFRREGERGWTTSVVGYLVVTMTMFLGFPSQPEMGMAVTIIIAFGDGAATLVGMLAQGRRLPWNADKSWAGLGAFLLCSIPPAVLVFWAEARPGMPASLALACVVPAAMASALMESLRISINDNIRVGTTAALLVLLTQRAFAGL